MPAPPEPQPAVFGLRAAVAAVIVGALAVPFGLLVLLVRGRWAPLWHFDHGTVAWLHDVALAHPLFVLAMKAASRVGSGPVYWVLTAVVAGWLLYRTRSREGLYEAAFALIAVLGGASLNTIVKALVDRARPIVPDPVAHVGGLSFPSGHAQAAMIGYGVLVLLVGPALTARWRRVLVTLCVAAVLTIGFSRVALGVHYPSDVLGGYLLGAAWLGALLLAFGAALPPAAPTQVTQWAAWRPLRAGESEVHSDSRQ